MLKKIFKFFGGKPQSTSESLVLTAENDSELDDKFWKLLHDENLSEEEEMNLVNEITSKLAYGNTASYKDTGKLYQSYRRAAKICHPDNFMKWYDTPNLELATKWFQYVEGLYRSNNLPELLKALENLNIYKTAGLVLPPENLITDTYTF